MAASQVVSIFNSNIRSYSHFVLLQSCPTQRWQTGGSDFQSITARRVQAAGTEKIVHRKRSLNRIRDPAATFSISDDKKWRWRIFRYYTLAFDSHFHVDTVWQLRELKTSTELLNRAPHTTDEANEVYKACESAQPSNYCAKLSSHSIFFCLSCDFIGATIPSSPPMHRTSSIWVSVSFAGIPTSHKNT